MRDQIRRFMQDCPAAKGQIFANNPFGVFVRSEIPEKLYETGLVDREKYLITASVGAGNWAMIPWICIFDRSITTSATKGVYIVYLLSKDSKRLFLTFNQGCTEIRNQNSKRETIDIMHQKAEEIRSGISDHGFSPDCDIDLGDGLTELGVLYREGTIFYKQYDVDAIPEEAELRDDLSRMMETYREYAQASQKDDQTGVFRSWEIINRSTAVKTCDTDFIKNHESGIPKEICWFFDAEELESRQSIDIKLIYKSKEYNGYVRIDNSPSKRARIVWEGELGNLLKGYKIGDKAVFYKQGKNTYAIEMKNGNEELTMTGDETEMKIAEKLNAIKAYIGGKGFSYENQLIENFYLSLKSKPFVILAGTSGTGKTRLVRLFAEAIGATTENKRYHQVAVRPDWSDSTDLFGHTDLNGKFVPGCVLEFLVRAQKDPEHPYILCLDEMNLARVEYYMSDFLSVIETREFHREQIVTDPLVSEKAYGRDTDALGQYGKVLFPENLYVVGTVNMDETTFPFSRKVLDRANTIEFNYVNLMPDFSGTVEAVQLKEKNDFLKTEYLLLAQCPENEQEAIGMFCGQLERINRILQTANAHVGYRVRDEICFYLLNNRAAQLMTDDDAMDHEIMQKILPRIQGSGASVKEMLCRLFREILAGDYDRQGGDAAGMEKKLKENGNIRYRLSAQKVMFMVRRFEEDGFTSYWL